MSSLAPPTLAPISNLLIKRLSEKAKLPTRGSPLSAGYDLYRYIVYIASQLSWTRFDAFF
jgi:hypothetical protein